MSTSQKKTRLKGTKTEKTCVACGKSKNRQKDFKPRWSRCAKHRIKGTKSDPNCADCVAVVTGLIRQPRCIECDSKRTTKKGKKVTTPTVNTPTTVATPAAPTPEPVTVAPVTAQAPAAPEATPVQAPAPVAPTPVASEPTPEPVAVAAAAPKSKKSLTKLADLAKLLDEPSSEEGETNSPH